jgi:hypothetical protein
MSDGLVETVSRWFKHGLEEGYLNNPEPLFDMVKDLRNREAYRVGYYMGQDLISSLGSSSLHPAPFHTTA